MVTPAPYLPPPPYFFNKNKNKALLLIWPLYRESTLLSEQGEVRCVRMTEERRLLYEQGGSMFENAPAAHAKTASKRMPWLANYYFLLLVRSLAFLPASFCLW